MFSEIAWCFFFYIGYSVKVSVIPIEDTCSDPEKQPTAPV